MSETELQIRPLRALSDMYAAVELQKNYWGNDLESVIPAHMLYSLASYGGHVIAAFDGSQMVGVLVGFLGTNMDEGDRPAMANLQIVSKRMVVLPNYRNRGLAYKLKLAQRDIALKQGVRLVTWTFDPLLSTNAHLNVRKLGGVCHEFLEDYYGVDDAGGLARGGSSDRLFVEWWVTSRRVKERISGERGSLGLRQYFEANTPIINPTTPGLDGLPRPQESMYPPSGSMALLEIPTDFSVIARLDSGLAQLWRLHIRQLFQTVFGMGYMVTDFVREALENRDRSFYLLSYRSPQFDASLN
jgi:predicted GNAT superfamily acetyltransferase